MTIASAFNEIAVAQGGTAAKSGAITAAIDALNDALAGSDQPQAKTIEQAVRLLGEHIGGGGSSEVTVYVVNQASLSTPLNTTDIKVSKGAGTVVQTEQDTLHIQTPDGVEDVPCLKFAAAVGGVYEIEGADLTYVSGALTSDLLDGESSLPSVDSGTSLAFIAPNADAYAVCELTR